MVESHGKHPIIIRKVVKGGHGHHGGAWKVAYADFVTAMMALFIVLWLVNSEDQTKKAIAGYFNDPSGVRKEVGMGPGEGASTGGDSIAVNRGDMDKLKQTIKSALQTIPDFQKKLNGQVQMTVTGEGLRIELLETEKGVFFETGNAEPTSSAKELLSVMAGELGKLENPVAVEGHTDAKPFSGKGTYGNWELSVDRANTARRLMTSSGVAPNRIAQVRGFADRRLKLPDSPESASNRRVSIVVHYMPGQAGTASPEAATDTKPSPSSH